MTQTDPIQLYAQVADQSATVIGELLDIKNEDEPETITTPNGEFNNEEWLEAEAAELSKRREDLMEVVTAEGTVAYEQAD